MRSADVRRSDLVIVGALFLLGAFALFLVYDLKPEEVTTSVPLGGSIGLLALLVAPLLIRRVAPLSAGLVVGAVFVTFRVLQIPEGAMSSIALFIAVYSVGAFAENRRRATTVRSVIVVGSMLVLLAAILTEQDFVSLESITFASFTIVINTAFFVAAWLLGDASRQRYENEAELERRAEQLAAEREERAKRAVAVERVRIARELHDVVAHHVSVMGVQASAASRMLDRDISKAREALSHVEESGRNAVGELQRLVGFLRSDGDDDPRAPQPTLDALPALVERTRSAGLPVELRTIGKARPLPTSVELSAYRIVQEALTNVVRHAPGARTTVVLSHLADVLQVEIVNGRPAPGATPAGPSGGRGLVGMRERAAVLGGTLHHEPTADGGFRVVARLPTMSSFDEETAGVGG